MMLYRNLFFHFRPKSFSLFNRLIFLGSLLNKLVALKVNGILCLKISTIRPLSLHARNKLFLVQNLLLGILEIFCCVGLDKISMIKLLTCGNSKTWPVNVTQSYKTLLAGTQSDLLISIFSSKLD